MTTPSYIKPKEKVEKNLPDEDEMSILGRNIVTLMDTKEKLQEDLKQVNQELSMNQDKLAVLMDAAQLDLIRNSLGTFYTKVENHPHVKADLQEAFVAWLDSEGEGSIAKRTVHPQTLKSWVTERLESNQPLPPMVDNFTKTVVRTRRK